MIAAEAMLIGFDARQDCLDVSVWDEERRQRFLLRHDIDEPLSVDDSVWPSAFDRQERVKRPQWTGYVQDLWGDLGSLTSAAENLGIALRYAAFEVLEADCPVPSELSWRQRVPEPAGGALDYVFDAAGNQTGETSTTAEGAARSRQHTYDDAGRLAAMSSDFSPLATALAYDGRGFLRRSSATRAGTSDLETAEPTYGSEGLLYRRRTERDLTRPGAGDSGMAPMVQTGRSDYVLHFAGRPVAQLTRHDDGADGLVYLTTDHLGSPVLATDPAGTTTWSGGFDPFGRPYDFDPAGRRPFLRLPGQWADGTFSSHAFGGEVLYNVHRWYQSQTGRYTRTDPAGLIRSNLDLYGYARRNPLRFVDPYGLLTCVVISANTLFELGDAGIAFGDHSALLLTGPCRSSQSCSSPGPLLYDPAGGYSQQFPGAGSAETLTREVPGWSLGGFFDYHCNSGSDFLEVYCFDTTCCEEKQIDEQIPGGMAPGLCSVGVGGAVRGIGPFSSLGGTGTPAILRRGMNRLLQQHTGSGASSWTYTCPRSAD